MKARTNKQTRTANTKKDEEIDKLRQTYATDSRTKEEKEPEYDEKMKEIDKEWLDAIYKGNRPYYEEVIKDRKEYEELIKRMDENGNIK